MLVKCNHKRQISCVGQFALGARVGRNHSILRRVYTRSLLLHFRKALLESQGWEG